jgi:hypothetical protein
MEDRLLSDLDRDRERERGRVGVAQRQAEHETVVLDLHARLQRRVGEHAHAQVVAIADAGDAQHAVLGPIEDVEIERAALLSRLPRRAAPRERADRARLRAADRLGVLRHPRTDLLQALDGLRRERAVAARADVEQEVSALRSDVDQRPHELARRLPLRVGGVPAPVRVHREAGLPRALEGLSRNHLLRRGEVTGEARRRRAVLGAALVHAVVHQDRGGAARGRARAAPSRSRATTFLPTARRTRADRSRRSA